MRRRSRIDSLDLRALCLRYREVADLLRTEACVVFVKAARVGFFAFTRLRNLLTELFGEKGAEYLSVLTSGTRARDNPTLQFGAWLAQLRDGRRSEPELLRRFGHLAMHQLEISVPRYREQPESLRALAAHVGDPVSALRRSAAASRRLREDLLANAGRRRKELNRAIRTARTYLSLRELVKFEFVRGYELLRRIALRLEELLEWETGLVFQLEPHEVFSLPENIPAMAQLALERRHESERNKEVPVPAVIFSTRLEEIGRRPMP
jgi:hypothetical protein